MTVTFGFTPAVADEVDAMYADVIQVRGRS